jgi:hypothetical protein
MRNILRKKDKKNKSIAIYQIISIVLSTIAFAYILGSSFPVVSAQNPDQCVRINGAVQIVGSNVDTFCNNLGSAKNTTCTCTGRSGLADCRIKSTAIDSCQSQPEVASLASAPLPVGTLAANTGINWASRRLGNLQNPTPTNPATTTPTTGGIGGPGPGAGAETNLPNKGFSAILQANYKKILLGSLGAVVISFVIAFAKTGDAGRSLDIALRIGIGTAVGGGAAIGATALLGIATGPAGWIISAGMILGAMFSNILQRERERDINMQCKPWKAPTGGTNCGLCNNQKFPCTEYQCKTLGAGCELINKDTDEPRCVYTNPRDVNPPTITPLTSVLKTGYHYNPLPRGQTGVEIKYQDKECLPAFKPFSFGVQLDKQGYCKLEYLRTGNFSDMRYDFGGINAYLENHTQLMSFPGVANIEEEGGILNLTNGESYELYTRCESVNGYSNRAEFVFKFCIENEPDTSAPIIRGFNWNNNAPIAYFAENESREVKVQVYTDEPAKCKWSHEDKDYANMENNLTCQNSLLNFNNQLSYTCSGKLIGLQNREENKFYFRCNDTFGNINRQSNILTLIGTQALILTNVTPNNIVIKGSSGSIKVILEAKTSAGYQEGKSNCSYSSTGISSSYVKFSNTGSYGHSTNIWLGPGEYNYFLRCIDNGGNSDTKLIKFTVESDTQAPVIVRAFHEGSYLKIITNEESSCVYSTSNSNACNYEFKDGISMQSPENNNHQISWDPDKTFYIKCEDEFGNQPLPNECSLVARPYTIK